MHNAKRDEVVRKLREDHARQELERQQAAAADATDQPPPSTLLISSQDEVAIEKKAKSQIGVLEPRSFARAEVCQVPSLITPQTPELTICLLVHRAGGATAEEAKGHQGQAASGFDAEEVAQGHAGVGIDG
jgi:hypothetical protein